MDEIRLKVQVENLQDVEPFKSGIYEAALGQYLLERDQAFLQNTVFHHTK